MSKETETRAEGPAFDYLRRSFTAVDGLWFVKVEEAYGFDAALDIDQRVWEVMGKIQARAARKALGVEAKTLAALEQCLSLKMQVEDFEAEFNKPDENHLEVSLKVCPWVELLKKSGRLHLAETIAGRICTAEYTEWAKEFGAKLELSLSQTLCGGSGCCRIGFVR